MRNEKEKELAHQIANAVNSFGFDAEAFCKEMSLEHKTLQESFTRWIVCSWLQYCATLPDYMFDGRNIAVQRLAKKFVSQMGDDIYLPMI